MIIIILLLKSGGDSSEISCFDVCCVWFDFCWTTCFSWKNLWSRTVLSALQLSLMCASQLCLKKKCEIPLNSFSLFGLEMIFFYFQHRVCAVISQAPRGTVFCLTRCCLWSPQRRALSSTTVTQDTRHSLAQDIPTWIHQHALRQAHQTADSEVCTTVTGRRKDSFVLQ